MAQEQEKDPVIPCRIYIGNVAFKLSSKQIKDICESIGPVQDVTLPTNNDPQSTNLHRGFCFVTFEKADDAKRAVQELNNKQDPYYGRRLNVSWASERKKS